jgi:hypothetical protein
MRKLKIQVALTLLLCGWLSVTTISAQKTDGTHGLTLTREQWRHDLQYLAKELPRRHKNAFHTVSKEQFEKAVAELDAAIVGRGTISAAMVNAIELRKEFNATIVGEPTGSKPNNYSENDELTLPNSHARVSYSTRYYKLQDQDTPSPMPDKLIEPFWETYTAGHDSALEWILAQPLSR